jgi:DNA-binding NarL/FixJ family response regulator
VRLWRILVQLIRVGIVEDRDDHREALSSLMSAADGFRLAGVFRSMEDAIANIAADFPDVLLVDLGLPGMSGTDGIRLLKERYPKLATVAVTVFTDDARIFDALCAGASGYLLKKTPADKLLDGIREVTQGGAPMSPDVARKVIALFRKYRPPVEAEHDLTPHELRLLRLLVEGHSYRTAAAELGVTVHTVSFHLRNIYEKLQVHSKSEAVAKALLQRLV